MHNLFVGITFCFVENSTINPWGQYRIYPVSKNTSQRKVIKMKKNTIKKTICAALAAITAISAAACGNTSGHDRSYGRSSSHSEYKYVKLSASPVSSAELKADKGELSDKFNMGYARFSTELFKNTCHDDLKEGRNVLVSPESVIFALGMTANGADGETLTQMEKVLGGESIDSLNDDLLCLMHMANDDEDGQLNIANSIWTNNSLLKLKQEYADKLRQYYAADSFNESFCPETADEINAWISNNTNGMIPEMIDKIDPLDAAFLVNAAAFDAEWEEKYKDNAVLENSSFYSYDGQVQDCTLLHSEESIYLSDDDTQGFVKPYANEKYGFMALLPNDKDTSMADYVSALDAEKLIALWDNRSSEKVQTYTPEFTSDYDVNMNDALMAMGMTSAFADDADFSNMAEDSSDLKVSKVLHSTHIELDRKGTKAAAATVVSMKKEAVVVAAPIIEVRLDRPFVYAIIDMESGMPIFIGAVNTME